ncbi:MAG TPA: cupin domain-containing protein [Thermoplasmata archaeon]|nr:cupin domain-containing protein [Thermoplasmata archaeon]
MAAGSSEKGRTQIVLGRVRQSDVTTRTVIPSTRRPEFAPYNRIAESIGTSRKAPTLHVHRGEEVALYVLEGAVDHLGGDGSRSVLGQGAVLLATAGTELRHGFTVASGRTARWFSVVTTLAEPSATSAVTVAELDSRDRPPGPEGAVVRSLIGDDGVVRAASGSMLKHLEFFGAGTAFLPLGARRRGFAYVLHGEGRIHDAPVSAGQAALLEPQAGVAFGGNPGFSVLFGSALLDAPAGAAPRPV